MYTYAWMEYGRYSGIEVTVLKSSEVFKSRDECYRSALKARPPTPIGAVHVLLLDTPERSLRSYVDRLETFVNYPKYLLPKKHELAFAGLHYTGTGDITQCSACRIYLSDWKTYHDPLKRHSEACADCPYVLANASAEQRSLDVI